MISTDRIKATVLSMAIFASLIGCGDAKTYSDYVDDEDNAIENFIKSHNISVQGSMPEGDSTWLNESGKEIYYLYASGKSEGLYYHQVKKGDGEAPKENWTAYVRYAGYTLEGRMLYNCTAQYAPDPQSLKITSSGSTFGVGFQQALKNLRVGGKCKVIIPFSIGNENNLTLTGVTMSDANEYRPMYYEIELVGLE